MVAYAHAAVQVYGWAPSSFDRSTKQAVDEALYGRGRAADELRARLQPHLADGIQLAPTIINRLLCELTEEHGYEANLSAALRAAGVGPRELGLLCSAIPAYQRIIGAHAAQKEKPLVPSAWLGDIGDTLTVTGTIATDLTIDGYAYGTTQRLLIINTPEGTVKIITAAGWSYDATAGDEVTIVGTVKAHELYRDHKQTRLVRVRRLDVTPTPTDR
ncbi:MAG: hypothetical protein ACOYBY_16800 [Dermatophilaceae bacterium]